MPATRKSLGGGHRLNKRKTNRRRLNKRGGEGEIQVQPQQNLESEVQPSIMNQAKGQAKNYWDSLANPFSSKPKDEEREQQLGGKRRSHKRRKHIKKGELKKSYKSKRHYKKNKTKRLSHRLRRR